MSHKPILIMAGGTGGHVYPALAIADYLRGRNIPLIWLGTSNGLESRVVPDNGYSLLTINVKGLRSSGLLRWIVAPFMLVRAVLQAIIIIVRVKPGLALGMGGFVSGPGGVAAWLLRVPLFLHEQNSVAGLTNRLLMPLARAVMEGFPGTFEQAESIYTTGNPVRNNLLSLPAPEQRLQNRENDSMRLLILGGSQGANALNKNVPAILEQLFENVDIQVWHQTGHRHYASTKDRYVVMEKTAQIRVDAYIDDMNEAYSWADIVLCRAGALTIAELCVVGIASILVPYPYAVDDHQTRNAHYLSENGSAILLPESELKAKRLIELLTDFSKTRKQLLSMAQAARKLARPNATREVADICLGEMYA